MKKVLIFPAPFLIKSPTANQQNEYMISMLKDKMAIEGIGDFIEVNALNKSYYCKEVRKIIAERKRVSEALKAFPLIRKIYPSDANFVLVQVDQPRQVYETLIAAGIIVRDRSRIAGCEGCLRITIGTPEENTVLLDTLKNM